MSTTTTTTTAIELSTTSSITLERDYEREIESGSEGSRPSQDSISAIQVQDEPATTVTNVVEQEDVPPDGGYGWVCTACVFFINAHTWGINSAWGVFLAQYLSKSTFPEATQFEFALIGGLSVSMACVIPPAIAVVNRFLGMRVSLFIGTAFVFVAMLGSSYATRIWHLFLSQGVLFGWGMGFLYVTATAILPQWFSRRRSLALGLASAGAGLGGLAYNLAAGRIIEVFGLPWAYRILGFCSLAMNGLSSVLLRDRNSFVKPSKQAFDYREFGRTEVLLVIGWGFFSELGYVVLLYSLPNYALSIGLTHRQGSVVGAMLSLSLGLGRPLVGYLSDRFGRINIATLMTFACGVLCLTVWVPATNYASLLTFALLAGVCCGIFWTVVAPVTAEVVGLQRLPSSFGMICIAIVPAATFAEPIALQIVATAGYKTAQIFVGVLYIIASLSTWLLRSWKMHEVEQKAIRERQGERATLGVSKVWLTPRSLFLAGRF